MIVDQDKLAVLTVLSVAPLDELLRTVDRIWFLPSRHAEAARTIAPLMVAHLERERASYIESSEKIGKTDRHDGTVKGMSATIEEWRALLASPDLAQARDQIAKALEGG